jgi:hypothetical protein
MSFDSVGVEAGLVRDEVRRARAELYGFDESARQGRHDFILPHRQNVVTMSRVYFKSAF